MTYVHFLSNWFSSKLTLLVKNGWKLVDKNRNYRNQETKHIQSIRSGIKNAYKFVTEHPIYSCGVNILLPISNSLMISIKSLNRFKLNISYGLLVFKNVVI